MTSSSLVQRCLLARRCRAPYPSMPCSHVGTLSPHRTGSRSLHLFYPAAASSCSHRAEANNFYRSIHLRLLSTKSTIESNSERLKSSELSVQHEHDWPSNTDDFVDPNISEDRYTPRNEHQRKLVEFTKSLLSTADDTYAIGSCPITHIIQISNCIDSWLASGEHRYLGVQQAELLIKRLIMERGGGRSLLSEEKKETAFLKGNQAVTWDMYHLESLIISFNTLYYGKDFCDRIESIMSTFEEEYSDTVEVQYKLILSVLCNLDTAHAAVAAERILHQFESKLNAGKQFNHSNPPTTETYNNVITCWVNSGKGFYPHKFKPSFQHSSHPPANILAEMLHLYKQNLSRVRPDNITFNMVIGSLSQHQRRELSAASDHELKQIKQLAFVFLQEMLDFYKKGYDSCAPDMVAFSTVLNMYLRGTPDPEDSNLACTLLDEMLELSSSDSYVHDVRPSARHFNVVLGLMADQHRVDERALTKARRYIQIMEDLAEKEVPRSMDVDHYLESLTPHPSQPEDNSSFTSCKPDIVTYNSLIKIASNARMPEIAQEILNDIIKRSTSGDDSVKPNIITFNTVLHAWSKSKKSTIGPKSAEILHTMQKLSERGDFNVKPDNVSLTTVINSLIKSSSRTRGAPIQAEAIIEKMLANDDYAFKPDTITYTSLIKCWSESRRPKAASRAEEIIELLHKRYDEGHEECKPDSTAYNVALNAIAKSGVKNSAERTEALLQRMMARFEAGDLDLAPNAFSFSSVISAWSKSGDPNAGKYAERLLENMIELHERGIHNVAPNTVTYSSCIHAWSRSKQRNAGQKASALLKRMDQHDEKGYINIKPNIFSYTSAIDAWVNSADPNLLKEAEAIFELLIKRYESGDEDAAPTTATFNAMFRAIRHSSLEKVKYLKADQLFNRMKQMPQHGYRVKPDTATYNEYFSACACTEGDRTTRLAAFACVINNLTELQEDTRLQTDSYTWPAIWRACEYLLDINQDIKRINMVFELCVRSGAMSELVFNNMRNFLPPQYLQKKLNTNGSIKELSVRDLPPEWSRNVRLRRQRNRSSNASA